MDVLSQSGKSQIISRCRDARTTADHRPVASLELRIRPPPPLLKKAPDSAAWLTQQLEQKAVGRAVVGHDYFPWLKQGAN